MMRNYPRSIRIIKFISTLIKALLLIYVHLYLNQALRNGFLFHLALLIILLDQPTKKLLFFESLKHYRTRSNFVIYNIIYFHLKIKHHDDYYSQTMDVLKVHHNLVLNLNLLLMFTLQNLMHQRLYVSNLKDQFPIGYYIFNNILHLLFYQ
jgi:hypothetical protein